MHAIGVKEGNEVIIPTLTFAATAAVILYFKVLRSVLSGIQVQPDLYCRWHWYNN